MVETLIALRIMRLGRGLWISGRSSANVMVVFAKFPRAIVAVIRLGRYDEPQTISPVCMN